MNSLKLPKEGLDLENVLLGIETDLIEQALQMTGGNRTQASRLLGLKRTTLVERLRRYKGDSRQPGDTVSAD
jgi:sigma-54 dependent transcriptional regulator, flagellar regulatory protein